MSLLEQEAPIHKWFVRESWITLICFYSQSRNTLQDATSATRFAVSYDRNMDTFLICSIFWHGINHGHNPFIYTFWKPNYSDVTECEI